VARHRFSHPLSLDTSVTCSDYCSLVLIVDDLYRVLLGVFSNRGIVNSLAFVGFPPYIIWWKYFINKLNMYCQVYHDC
jgi:hypothetical protein